MLTVFFTAFTGVFLAEFGDKTQLVSLNLASRYSPLQVLGGAMVGLGGVLLIAVGAGGIIYNIISVDTIVIASGIFFIFMGICNYLVPEKEEVPDGGGHSGFYQAVFLTFFSELGDKTQIAAMLLSASLGMPLLVWAGAMLAMLLNHLLAVFVGARFLSLIPNIWLKRISSLVFVVIGVFILWWG